MMVPEESPVLSISRQHQDATSSRQLGSRQASSRLPLAARLPALQLRTDIRVRIGPDVLPADVHVVGRIGGMLPLLSGGMLPLLRRALPQSRRSDDDRDHCHRYEPFRIHKIVPHFRAQCRCCKRPVPCRLCSWSTRLATGGGAGESDLRQRHPPWTGLGGPLMSVHAVVIALALVALPFSSASAQQPPWSGCISVSKREYDSAQKSRIGHRLGSYVRTRVWLRRFYWYCPLGSG